MPNLSTALLPHVCRAPPPSLAPRQLVRTLALISGLITEFTVIQTSLLVFSRLVVQDCARFSSGQLETKLRHGVAQTNRTYPGFRHSV